MASALGRAGRAFVNVAAELTNRLDTFTGGHRQFGYDATEDRGRRRQITTPEKHEDCIAPERTRKILSQNSRDLARNFVIAQRAIRRHLDYTTCFSYQAKTGNTGLDTTLEALIAKRSDRTRFDAAKRHPMRRFVRLSEACRVIDGDLGWLTIAPGPGHPLDGTVQAIESELVRTPKDQTANARWINGVLTDGAGAALGYGLHTRRGKTAQFEFDRIVPESNLYLHAWYDFRFDQVRGISPIASALNWFRDTYEGLEFAFAKLKTSQLFGLKVSRNGETSTMGSPTPTTNPDADGNKRSGYEVDVHRGPFMVDMDPGDDISVIESHTPSTETVNFLKLMIHIALQSLDIPYSFFDESFTNFYGSRGGLIQYRKSCKSKIADMQDLLNRWTRWQYQLAILRGELVLPSGFSIDDIVDEWVPDGVPWWDATKEVRGAVMAIAAGLDSPQRACREAGTNFEDNIDQIKEAMAYAKNAEVPIVFADSSAFAPEITVNANDTQ